MNELLVRHILFQHFNAFSCQATIHGCVFLLVQGSSLQSVVVVRLPSSSSPRSTSVPRGTRHSHGWCHQLMTRKMPPTKRSRHRRDHCCCCLNYDGRSATTTTTTMMTMRRTTTPSPTTTILEQPRENTGTRGTKASKMYAKLGKRRFSSRSQHINLLNINNRITLINHDDDILSDNLIIQTTTIDTLSFAQL